eukprot:Gb_06990 [translate_table: standard]
MLHQFMDCPAPTEWTQRTFALPEFKRGCHIITRHIYEAVPEINQFEIGLANLFILHTSASLTINENASRDVPLDMEDALNKIVPELKTIPRDICTKLLLTLPKKEVHQDSWEEDSFNDLWTVDMAALELR